jgi:hypothetical protein
LTKIWGLVNFITNYERFVTSQTHEHNKFIIFNVLYGRIVSAAWGQQLAANRSCRSVKMACGYEFLKKAPCARAKAAALTLTVRPASPYPG